MSLPTIEDFADAPLFERLLALAENARKSTDDSVRCVLEAFLKADKYEGRVYVKRRTSDPEEAREALHEEGIFDVARWKRVVAKMEEDGGVNTGRVFNVEVVPFDHVELTVFRDPCQVAAVAAMTRNRIARNRFERVCTDDADDSDSDSDAESDADSESD